MKRYLLILCVFVLFSCKKEQGCTDQIAINFNSTAEEDDGSCIYSFVGGYWINNLSLLRVLLQLLVVLLFQIVHLISQKKS